MSGIRTFISFVTPEDIREEMERLQARLKQSGADVHWEDPEKFHVTIKFLGDIERTRLDTVIAEIESVAQQHQSFEIRYHGLGAFPSTRHPRVIWIGCENSDGRLLRLKAALDEQLLPFGFEVEERGFHPHITLGRVKSPLGKNYLTPMLEKCTFEPRSTRVDGILVMRSVLSPQGAEHTVLRSVQLQS